MSAGHAAVMAHAGITYSQLDTWTRKGYLHAGNDDCGSGYAREWPASEQAVAAVMGRLVAAGLSPAAAHTVARSPGCVTELAPGIRIAVDA